MDLGVVKNLFPVKDEVIDLLLKDFWGKEKPVSAIIFEIDK